MHITRINIDNQQSLNQQKLKLSKIHKSTSSQLNTPVNTNF